jgi:hypothetical protein
MWGDERVSQGLIGTLLLRTPSQPKLFLSSMGRNFLQNPL